MRRRARVRPPPSRTQRILGRHPVLSILGILATLTLTFISLTAYAAYRNVYDSIHHVTITSHELGHRPPKLDGSTNILIIGSDSRAGTHGKFGRGIDGSRSDTSMLLHIPPNHSGALVVSFPRDTMVPIFQCDADGSGHPGQQAQPGGVEQLNWTYSYGGAACLWKTLEQVTHIHIDHFVEVNFLSFRKIVNDVGGVPVCLPYAIKDPASRLNLPAGQERRQRLTGAGVRPRAPHRLRLRPAAHQPPADLPGLAGAEDQASRARCPARPSCTAWSTTSPAPSPPTAA